MHDRRTNWPSFQQLRGASTEYLSQLRKLTHGLQCDDVTVFKKASAHSLEGCLIESCQPDPESKLKLEWVAARLLQLTTQ